MAVSFDQSRASGCSMLTLEDKFEVVKEIGDGSFGSVSLARVRTVGSYMARRGTLIAVKTMKKSFDHFSQCLELREVVFMRSLPPHAHLVPALDIFLDPLSRKLHICMEYMDGNLYQLMKARDHKCMDARTVKSILYQIMSGLDHIHSNRFFHRDIKPENILISSSAPSDFSLSRYSSMVTPPSTPPSYTVKIADFGLAREIHSSAPYTTYVSTRWYRAPEVLLRAGQYSTPVDMWAVGAMAVEIATLKPLFPGRNEVDQVWRVCEIMGSPGNWYTKQGQKIGGGEWKEGARLAQRLGFSFPKMAPHSMESILPSSQFPASLSRFVSWCLLWDPKSRPTSTQALNHEYFTDAVDPLRPKSSTSRLLGRKQSDKSFRSRDGDSPASSSRPSWFRRSLIGTGRESPAPIVEQEPAAKPGLVSFNAAPPEAPIGNRKASKRATWANGAPMPILPSIRPVSPLSNTINAQAKSHISPASEKTPTTKKIGRQLSISSTTNNHYADLHRQDAERALNGGSYVTPPASTQKESFFSHLRKRARRLSGRNQSSVSVGDDGDSSSAGAIWSNRSSMVLDSVNIPSAKNAEFSELGRALQNIRYSLDAPSQQQSSTDMQVRRQSMPVRNSSVNSSGPISSRTRRALQLSAHPTERYETPEEEDELLHEMLNSTRRAVRRLSNLKSDPRENSNTFPAGRGLSNRSPIPNPYPTPSPSAKYDPLSHSDLSSPSKPMKAGYGIAPMEKDSVPRQWPTPPYDDHHWAPDMFATGAVR